MTYKIIDLFAGPGGLGEGFAAYKKGTIFDIALSAEMESSAHQTLTLRSFFRKIRGDQKALNAYYSFCESEDSPHPRDLFPLAWKAASAEAHKLTLGNPECWRRSNIDHLCRLNFDQGLEPAFMSAGCG